MSGGTQLPLAFSPPPAMGEADFVSTTGNAEALAWVRLWPNWPSHGLVLTGPTGSGKTHLVHIWTARSNAAVATDLGLPAAPCLVIEGIDKLLTSPEAEEKLFHLLNHMAGRAGHILLTAQSAPVLWPVGLPDLRSRLLALPAVHIHLPDDAGLAAVLGKLFADRQLRVPPDVLDYLVRRIERSYASANEVVMALDAAALATGRPLTLPLAREVLARVAEIPGR